MTYVKWTLVALGVILLCFVGYGAYKFYFMKPVPNTQSFTIMPGATANIKQVEEIKKNQHLMTGVYFSKDEIGGTVSWLW